MEIVYAAADRFGAEAVAMAFAVLTFALVGGFGSLVLAQARAQTGVKRRVADLKPAEAGGRALRPRDRSRAMVDRVGKHFGAADGTKTKVLRTRLIQAGFYEPSAVAWYFVLRLLGALLAGALAFAALPLYAKTLTAQALMTTAAAAALIGYYLPELALSKRIAGRRDEHRAGFPDFMDLMVVCADAGLSMEAALDRVGRELAESYPSLSANLYMATLELRAGRTLGEALEHLGDRLALDEARTFATLLQQSEELGSSLTDALRVYSDDMRHKRLSRAEEKAYALPAKLVIPLGIFIFPTLFVVILLPAAIRVMQQGL